MVFYVTRENAIFILKFSHNLKRGTWEMKAFSKLVDCDLSCEKKNYRKILKIKRATLWRIHVFYVMHENAIFI